MLAVKSTRQLVAACFGTEPDTDLTSGHSRAALETDADRASRQTLAKERTRVTQVLASQRSLDFGLSTIVNWNRRPKVLKKAYKFKARLFLCRVQFDTGCFFEDLEICFKISVKAIQLRYVLVRPGERDIGEIIVGISRLISSNLITRCTGESFWYVTCYWPINESTRLS